MLFINILHIVLFAIINANQDEIDSCGPNCQFSITQNILTIEGTGRMMKFYSVEEIQGRRDRNSITQIKISGISVINEKAFQDLPNLE